MRSAYTKYKLPPCTTYPLNVKGEHMEPENLRERRVGRVGNYYGHLSVKKTDGRFYWGIEDCTGTDWQEIPEPLFRELCSYGQGPEIAE